MKYIASFAVDIFNVKYFKKFNNVCSDKNDLIRIFFFLV